MVGLRQGGAARPGAVADDLVVSGGATKEKLRWLGGWWCGGNLAIPQVLVEDSAHNEAELHQLNVGSPGTPASRRIRIGRPLLAVGKETGLASGSVYLVGLTSGGDLLIIEFKTGPQNPDFRSALAQTLDHSSDMFGMGADVFEETVALRYSRGNRCTSDYKNTGSLTEALSVAAKIGAGLSVGGLSGAQEMRPRRKHSTSLSRRTRARRICRPAPR
jgi:hypothetical protein